MKKSLLTTLLLSGMAFGAMAETAVIDFTYAEGDLAAYGKGKKETIDVAMCISDPSMAGMKITGIKAYINAIEGLSETSLWMSSDLVIENKVNVADIASYDVTPVETEFGGYTLGLLSVELDEPYVLTSEPLYIGYSITVDDVTYDGQKYPIIYAKQAANPNGLFVHMTKTVLKWRDYSDTVGGVAMIVASIEGDFPEYSLGVVNYSPIYASDGEEYTADLTVSNIGGNAIENATYTYSVDGGAAQEGYVEFPVPVEPSLATTSNVTFYFDAITGTGPHDVELNITEVNGKPNESVAAKSVLRVNVIPFVPTHRPLVEEYTGLWCGWCTRGFLAMEMIAEYYGANEVSICYHNGDPMAITNSYPMNVSGFPSASIDRISIIDPYYGSYNDDFGISRDLTNAMNELALADIDVEASLEGTEVNIKSSTRFIQDIDDANYQVGYVLVCNGLTDPDWVQHNYYAGVSGYAGSYLDELTKWDANVTGLIFNDVAVDVNGMSGVANSLPSAIKTGEAYENTFSYDIDGNVLVQNVENLVVAAFIVDKNTGRIVNANKALLSGESGINEIGTDASVVARQYFDLTGRKVMNPSNGVFIKSEKLSDGTVRTSKVMINK